jgi:8-oxo-dGTP pyrophosphatase MutT (NUDIX family)
MEIDDVSAVATALRESDEEIGLAGERVDVLGSLRAYDTRTGFRIYPVVGWVADPPARWRPDPAEVADIFEVPVAFVLDPANHRRDSYVRDSERRFFYVLPFENRYIWGATAGILVNFARSLTG